VKDRRFQCNKTVFLQHSTTLLGRSLTLLGSNKYCAGLRELFEIKMQIGGRVYRQKNGWVGRKPCIQKEAYMGVDG
jgi:hypothetical protein